MNCPLCHSLNLTEYFNTTEKVFKLPKQRTYKACAQCSLVFLIPSQRLGPAKEKLRYDVHENNLEQQGYKNFLMQVWEPLKQHINAPAHGLDFGSGPTRALAELIEADGIKMETYDPFFKPEFEVKKYDFITCTEVLEHVFNLNLVLNKLDELLKPGGHLAIMTELLTCKINFAKWRYREDDTHVCFFKEDTFKYISEKYSFKWVYFDKQRVILFKKSVS